MSDRELYQQKLQAQLDEWKAELDKLKAKVAGASADAQLKMNQQVASLEGKIEEGKTKLSELAEASSDAWASVKNGVESAWESMRSAFSDAASKFKG